MSLTFGIAILKTGLMDHLRLPARRNALLRAVGMRATRKGAGSFTTDTDLSEDAQITILRRSGLEIWTGYPIAYMIEAMHQTSPALPRTEALFIAQERHAGLSLTQYIKGGHYGPGTAGPDTGKNTWRRTFQVGQTIPRSCAMDAAARDLADELGAPLDLVERALKGTRGKGFYGLAWHDTKAAWVMARSLAKNAWEAPTQLQQINPRSYAKTGKPFPLGTAKATAFLTHDGLNYEVQHMAIARYLGARLDTVAGLALLDGKSCKRFDISRI